MLTYREISEILKMVDASECEEFVLELEGVKLVIRRSSGAQMASATTGTAGAGTITSTAGGLSQTASPVTTSAQTPGAPSAPVFGTRQVGNGEGVPATTGTEMRSPMVGTFYRRSAPDKAPYVEAGDRVEPGDALCLIEVMKLFTTIESTVSGTVVSIFADDGDFVEYDQLLFVFDTAAT